MITGRCDSLLRPCSDKRNPKPCYKKHNRELLFSLRHRYSKISKKETQIVSPNVVFFLHRRSRHVGFSMLKSTADYYLACALLRLCQQYKRTVLWERDDECLFFLRSFDLNLEKHKMFYTFNLSQSAVISRILNSLSMKRNNPRLIRQRHNQVTTVESCFDLVGSGRWVSCFNPTRSKQLSTVAILGFQSGRYHVVVPLSFLCSNQPCIIVFLPFNFWLIKSFKDHT